MRWMVILMVFLLAPVSTASAEPDIWAAAREGDLARVKALLESGTDVDAKTRYDVTPLYFAAAHGHLELVDFLLAKGAETDVREGFLMQSPLTAAIAGKHAEVAVRLIEHGAVDTMYTTLTDSVENDLPSVVAALLRRGPVFDFEKTAALALAEKAGSEELVALLERAEVRTELPIVELGAADLERVAGAYRAQGDRRVDVTLHEGALTLREGDAPPTRLAALSRFLFRSPADHDFGALFRGRLGIVEWMLLGRGADVEWFHRFEPDPTEVVAAVAPAKLDEVAAPRTAAINWPSFRGPNAAGVGDGQGVPTTWDVASGKNVLWKTALPGLAHSSPAVWGDRVFVTVAISLGGDEPEEVGKRADYAVDNQAVHTWKTLALDKATGEVVWQHTAATAVPLTGRHATSSQANSTPATDGRYVVVVFPTAGMHCFTVGGDLVWKKDLGGLNAGNYVDASIPWGFASSPIVDGGRVILQVDVHEGAFLAAYDLATGRELWKTPRDEVSTWATPMVYHGGEHAEIVTNAPTIRGYDLATGRELWTLRPNSEQVMATPIAAHGLIYVTTGYPPAFPIYAIRPGQRSDLSLPDGATASAAIAWSHPRGGSYLVTPIVYDDLLYVPADGGRLAAYDALTGERVYRARLSKAGNFTSSPVAADGRLFLPTEEGIVYVIKTGRAYEELALNDMGEGLTATPAISDGALFVRTRHHLYALGTKQE